MQSGGTLDALSLVKIFAVLGVAGLFTAKLALDWANGKRPFRGDAGGWAGQDSPDHHHGGWWDGDDGGGHGDGGGGGH